MELSQKLIIDADPGIGDAVAIAVALHDSRLDVLGITATAGCVSGADAGRNVQVVLENLDPPRLPRIGYSGAMIPVTGAGAARGEFRPSELNGPSGLGDSVFRVAELHHHHESAKLMVDIVRTHPHEVTLLTLGPLTNLELACERAPDFLSLLKGLICLGGSIAVGGDVTAAAEFNVYANPEAARIVLGFPATKTLAPLDVSRNVVLSYQQFDRLVSAGTNRLGQFLGELLPYFFKSHHEHLGLEGVRLPELAALAAIAEPQLFESRPMIMDVETSGELTRGLTVFDRRGVGRWQANIDVLTAVDAQGVLDYVTRIVCECAS